MPTVPPPLREIVNATGSAGGTVLLVDDDPMVRSMTALMLSSEGWKVVEAGEGRDALAIWAAHRGEIVRIILDVTMPGLDGPATLAALRAAGCDVATVLVSGHDEGDVGERCAGLGAAAVVHKPFTREELLGAVAGAQAFPTRGHRCVAFYQPPP